MTRLNLQPHGPFMFQVAIDGKYEEAIQIRAPFSEFPEEKIRELARAYAKNVSIEFFYKTQDGRDCYLGMKHAKPASGENAATNFLLPSISAFIESGSTFNSFITSLEKSLNLDQNSLLDYPPDQIELGVNGWWFTFGPQVIWTASDKPLTQETLDQKLAGRDDLLVNEKNFVGAELIFTSPIEHWFSVQVSELVNGKYILNKDLVIEAAS